MSSLADYKLEFEDIPPSHRKLIRVGKVNKMTKSAKTTDAPAKVYNKTRGEHTKDIVIAILVTSIIAFGLGVKFQSDRNAEVANAVKASQATASVQATEVKK